MPTVNLSLSGDTYQDFVVASPITGVVRIVNNGAFSIYVRDTTTGNEWKVRLGATGDVPVIQGRKYTILACGDVSLTYTLIPG